MPQGKQSAPLQKSRLTIEHDHHQQPTKQALSSRDRQEQFGGHSALTAVPINFNTECFQLNQVDVNTFSNYKAHINTIGLDYTKASKHMHT